MSINKTTVNDIDETRYRLNDNNVGLMQMQHVFYLAKVKTSTASGHLSIDVHDSKCFDWLLLGRCEHLQALIAEPFFFSL